MLVGHALLEGRTIGMRNAGTTGPAGRGYSDAFNEWLTYNRFDMSPSHRSKLLTAMGLLPEIRGLARDPDTRQRRTSHPGAVLLNYRKAIRIKPALERVTAPSAAP